MRAAKLISPRRMEICEEELSEVASPGRAIVNVKVVGICGTDIHIFAGERDDARMPLTIGHELSGVVERVGEGVGNVRVGDHVVLDPVVSCGVCRVCKSGHPNVCADVKCFGVQMEGGLKEHIEVDAAQLYVISGEVSFREAALIEPFSIAANILTNARVKAGETVCIIGIGTIGLCLIQAAKGIGARVIASDIVSSKFEMAERFGCDRVVNAQTEPLGGAVADFAPNGPDVIIDAAGTHELMEVCMALAKPLSRVVVISFDGEAAEIRPVEITKKELQIIGSRMNARQFPKAIKWMEEGRIHPAAMISRVYPFDRCQEAFEAALADKSLIKVLIDLEGVRVDEYHGKEGKHHDGAV